MTKRLLDLSTKELVGIHNGLNPGGPLTGWKSGKPALIKRIQALRRKTKKEAPRRSRTASAAKSTPKSTAKPRARTGSRKATGKPRSRTIRAAAIELLCETVSYENRDKPVGSDNVVTKGSRHATSVGIPYDEIIRRIKAEFLDCATTVACLRWYAVKIRVEEHGYEGLRLPQRRPRVKPKEVL